MKPLYDFITSQQQDCHIHLFDIHGSIKPCDPMGVGFPDISMRTEPELYTHDAVIEMYEKNINKFPGYTILATAVEPRTAIDVLERFNLRGFGELKCYTETKDGRPLPYKSESYWRPLFEYANEHELPVWIHWSLLSDEDYCDLYDILAKYPKARFVICHCGIDGDNKLKKVNTTAVQCFERCLRLLKEHPNAYCDVSWTAAVFMAEHPQYNLPEGKCVIGSDLNPHDYREDPNAYIKNLRYYERIKPMRVYSNIYSIL